MSEDFPQDPNQIQPPQEGETRHIEVASHDGGVELGGVALSDNAENTNAHQAEQRPSDVPAHLGSIDHAEEIPSTYVRNKEKAEIMAHAQNDAIDENDRLERQGKYDEMYQDVEWAGEYAGREYEVRQALATYVHEGVTTPDEALRLAKHDRSMFLRYGHAIAENHRKHGDTLSLGLQAIDKVYEFQEKMLKLGGDKLWASQGFRVSTIENATIKTAKGYYGGMDVLLVRESGKEWSLSMFDDGEYKVSKTEHDPDGEFQETQTIRRRNITEADVADLDKTLTGWVEDHVKRADAEKRRLYYEELEELEREGQTEDPLAGDVDRWVHPDETRTDEQIARDEKYKVESY